MAIIEGSSTKQLELSKPAVPHLTAITAKEQNVVDGLHTLVAHDAGIVWLKAMAAYPLRRPTTTVQYQPEEEAYPRWRRRPPDFLSTDRLR